MADGEHPITFAPPATRAAYLTAADDLVAMVTDVAAALGPEGWDAPGLGVWSLRSLIGHAGRALATVTAYLDAGVGRPIEVEHAFDYFAVLLTAQADPEAVAERGRQAGLELGDDPVTAVMQLRDDALAAVEAVADDAPAASPAGVMRLSDYLVSRVFELTIHTGDVARAAGVEFVPARDPAMITLTVLGALVAARPGTSDVIAALTGRGALPEGYSTL